MAANSAVASTGASRISVEAALLALGDEDAVDREDRREQDRRQQHPGGEAALEPVAVEAEAEEDEGGDANSAIAGTDSSVRSSVRRSLARIAR